MHNFTSYYDQLGNLFPHRRVGFLLPFDFPQRAETEDTFVQAFDTANASCVESVKAVRISFDSQSNKFKYSRSPRVAHEHPRITTLLSHPRP